MQVVEDFGRLLEQLSLGDPPDVELYKLSNLHGEELARMAAFWPTLPIERRRALASRLAEIAEADFEADFTELFKICLGDSDAQVRVSAIEGLWEVEDVTMIRPLVCMLQKDESIPVREAAASSLSRFALLAELGRLQPRQVSVIWEALWKAIHGPEEDLSVRRRALESLAYFDRPEVTQVIEQAYQDEEPKMRVSAVFAMGRSNDEVWADKVLAELYTDDPEMRYEATRASGELRLIEATSALSQLVADADPEVRLTAVWSLGQIGTPEARRVLEICAEQGNEALQDAANEALDEMDYMQGDIEFPLYDFPDDVNGEIAFWDGEDTFD
jgi:HEAT repeat protein